MQELLRKSATEQFKALKNKEISAVELTKASLERIKNIDEKLGAFNSLTEEIAIETAKKALDYVEDDYSVYYILGTANMAARRFEDSVEYIQKAIELNPENLQLYNNLGTSYLTIGDLDKAFETYLQYD